MNGYSLSGLLYKAVCIMVITLATYQLSGTASGQTVDPPPGPRNLPYSPAEGAIVNVNPPPFIWVPSNEAKGYRLEISRDCEFASDDMAQFETDISIFALDRTLLPGRWFWRYGVVTNDGDVIMGKSREFDVSPDAVNLPFPDLSRILPRIPHDRPRLFVTKKDVASFRAKVLRERSDDLTSFLAGCSRYIGEEIVPEPPYVTGEGAERGENYAHIFRTTRPPMDKMERSALAYLLTGDKTHGLEAKRRILHFFSWDPEGSTSYRNNDEPAMWVMMRGVRAYDWTADLFTDEERHHVEGVMRIRARQFYEHLKDRRRFHTDPFESHAGRTIGFLGEVSLAFIHEWPEAEEYLRYVLTNFWNVYPAWGKEDGGWHEGPSYWSYYMGFALHFIVPLKNLTGIDLLRKPFFANTPWFKLYSNPPAAKISPFGDGEHAGPNTSMGQLMYWFGALLDEPRFVWYAEEMGAGPGTGPIGFVTGSPSLIAKAPSDVPNARFFPGVGLVSMHTALDNPEKDIHLLFHSDPYGAISHGHADQNAFTVEAFGEALAIASGYYPWYGSDHHSNWQWHSRSSNTITFDGGVGQNIRSKESHGEITDFADGTWFDYALGDASPAYEGKLERALRHVLQSGDGIFFICDDLDSKVGHTYEWRLHALEQMDIDEQNGEVTIVRGNARLRSVLRSATGLRFKQTNEIPWPPEDDSPPQWHMTASTDRSLTACWFCAVLLPSEGPSEAHVRDIDNGRCAGFAVERGGIETIVLMRKPGTTHSIRAEGLESDGSIAAVRIDAGQVIETFQHGGTFVRYRGK